MRRKLITGIAALIIGTLVPFSPSASSETSETPPPAEEWSGTLRPGESLKDAAAGGNILVHQTDGNVVVYNVDREPIWSTRTHGKDTSRLEVQPDGNLVLYDAANRPIFHSATHGTDSRLTLQGDANLVLYEGTTVKWAALHWPPKPPAPSYMGGGGGWCGGWEGLISRYFSDVGTACRVMMCESKGNPRAVNGDPRYYASGLFQIIKQWATRYGQVTGVPYYDGRFDPEANTKFAAYLVNAEGWASQFDCY